MPLSALAARCHSGFRFLQWPHHWREGGREGVGLAAAMLAGGGSALPVSGGGGGKAAGLPSQIRY